MKLNHINLSVENVNETKDFFEKYFDFKCVDEKGDNVLAVLKGLDNFTLVLMSSSFNRDKSSEYPAAFHIGFLVDTKEEVMHQYAKLKNGNVPLENEPKNMRGIFGFYFIAPGKILVEVSTVSK